MPTKALGVWAIPATMSSIVEIDVNPFWTELVQGVGQPFYRAVSGGPDTRQGGCSGGVVEQQTERVAAAVSYHADPVAHGCRRPTPPAGDRPFGGGNHHCMAVADSHCGGPGLGPEALFDDHSSPPR